MAIVGQSAPCSQVAASAVDQASPPSKPQRFVGALEPAVAEAAHHDVLADAQQHEIGDAVAVDVERIGAGHAVELQPALLRLEMQRAAARAGVAIELGRRRRRRPAACRGSRRRCSRRSRRRRRPCIPIRRHRCCRCRRSRSPRRSSGSAAFALGSGRGARPATQGTARQGEGRRTHGLSPRLAGRRRRRRCSAPAPGPARWRRGNGCRHRAARCRPRRPPPRSLGNCAACRPSRLSVSSSKANCRRTARSAPRPPRPIGCCGRWDIRERAAC